MKFLVSVHLPDDYDPTAEDEGVARGLHALNEEIDAAGGMVFACGLQPAALAKTVRVRPGGGALVTDGPYLETREHIGGFLILEAADLDEALDWARKGAIVGRRAVEVRQIFFDER